MTADNKEFTVTISLDEFHEIFGVLQDKSIKNKEEIELLTGVDVFFPKCPTTEDQERAANLAKENELINCFLTKIYEQTNKELGL